MLRSMLFLIGGLLGGWLLASWWSPASESVSSDVGTSATSGGSVGARTAALESALASEREQRLELAAGLGALEDAVARLEQAPAAGATPIRERTAGRDDAAGRDSRSDSEDGPFTERVTRVRERRAASSEERRAERLTDAGFAPDRAEWIVRREAELRMTELQAQYEARRGGEPLDGALEDRAAVLRTELGETDYERYLEATGRPTSVAVRNVLAGSPAEQAGLEPGDRLVAYGGQRVYGVGELNDLTIEGAAGAPVTVDVVRDGQTIQLVIPRGPLGITGGGRFGRRGR